MIGNNSCGVHSVMAGKTDDNIEVARIVTYDGTRMKRRRNQPATELELHHPRAGHDQIARGNLCRPESTSPINTAI